MARASEPVPHNSIVAKSSDRPIHCVGPIHGRCAALSDVSTVSHLPPNLQIRGGQSYPEWLTPLAEGVQHVFGNPVTSEGPMLDALEDYEESVAQGVTPPHPDDIGVRSLRSLRMASIQNLVG